MKLIFKNIFKDFVFTYKNFGSWLKVKVVIYLASIIAGFVVSALFLGLYTIFSEHGFLENA